MLRFRWLVSAALIALVAIFVACSGSSSTSGIPPITGIVIRAETLTTGRGCGRGPTQLFKYVAVVYGYSGSGDANDRASYTNPVTSGIYDCFADGTFVELPQTGGSFTFRLDVFAFSEPAYVAQRAAIEGAGANADTLRAASPTWTTTCVATQQRDVQSLAVCEPLAEFDSEAQIVLNTSAFQRADGRTTSCGRISADAGTDAGADADADADAGEDAGADAGEDAGVDAGEEGGTDAGTTDPALTFLTVRARASLNGAEVVPATELPCPDSFVVRNAVPNGDYRLHVELLGSTGALVGTTDCAAVAKIGAQTAATCAPVK